MLEFDYDLFVIGAGSGGVRAARIAASHGARVAIAEEYRIGGTCVIRGCVPKKLLVYASRFTDEFEDAEGFGWSLEGARFDWQSLIAAKDNEIARLEAVYGATLAKFNVELFAERATVAAPHGVKLTQSGRTVSAKAILIATGGRPNLDENLPGIEHVITSNEAFHLKEMPRRVVIAGGGYIAVEFASIFKGLGADVTLIYRRDKILRGFDEDLRNALTTAMTSRGIHIIAGHIFTRIEKTQTGLAGHITGGEVVEADQIMFAIGRSPNTAGLGLEGVGVKLSGNGAVAVEGTWQTSVPSIYAVGDVTDRVNLTPVAIREGHAFADTVFGNKAWTVDYKAIPTAVFATPEIGTVGFSEHEARAQYGDIDIYKASFRPMKAILAGRDERMLMKLVVERASDRVVGVHILGPDAAEIVQMAAVAIRMGAKKSDFDQTMALHPSAAEELVTLREKWIAPGEAAG
ncbi:MAG TPA: glutathione-disulfide reductase [Hyphomicrobium sp.]|jgi:glutathione reductase (NADPH)|uniref:glutathione-disulfide reductase n=1 Tax=Hyphomicrobium sp. TaxID=82 RepID=UPI002C9DE68C|nr:glutathione-disulfide reductase [Hyphomicrobium sp.]HXE00444.1 glutathione-disulfide reductase [Hyphomicrobium sp.]